MNKEEAEAILTEVCDKTKVSPWDVYKDWATISLDELLAFANACEKIGMEKAAMISAMYCINKNEIHPDIPYDCMSETAQMIAHTTCQYVAEAIRAHKE